MMKNGSFGQAGHEAQPMATPPASSSARGWLTSCLVRSWPRFASPTERVTMMPVAIEISRAGIWETRPSPTVSSEKCWMASEKPIPCWKTPTVRPPTRLIIMIRTAAMASPFTNFEAPSIAP